MSAKGNSPEKAEGLQYILDVGIALDVHNLREISAPLDAASAPNEFKVYYADTGLLISQLERDTAVKVLRGDMSAYKGAVAENMCACSFVSAGYNPLLLPGVERLSRTRFCIFKRWYSDYCGMQIYKWTSYKHELRVGSP